MGTRINIMGRDKTPRCSCGKPLPCPDHSGDDGDTADVYNPHIGENASEYKNETVDRHNQN